MNQPAARAAIVAAIVAVTVAVCVYFFIGFAQKKEAETALRLRRDGATVATTVTSQLERRPTNRSRGSSQDRSVTCESILDGQLAQGPAVRFTLSESGNCMRRVGSTLDVVVSRSDTSVWMLRERFEGRDASGHESSEGTTRAIGASAAGLIVGLVLFLVTRKKRR